LVDLASKLPDYQNNIQAKLRAFKPGVGGRFTRLSETVEQLRKELPGAPAESNAPAPVATQPEEAAGPLLPTIVAPVPAPLVPVQVVNGSGINPFQMAGAIVSPLLGPLGTAALVLLLMIFMLLKREDLRNRIIRLIGQGRISLTTRAMDDAGSRVTRYLLMQLIVNVTYGVMPSFGEFPPPSFVSSLTSAHGSGPHCLWPSRSPSHRAGPCRS
jgi:hypothetical protein